MVNEVVLSGHTCNVRPLRATPAGIPVAEFSLRHLSTQAEAGGSRRVEFEMPAIAFGALAQRVAREQSGTSVVARGFLASRGKPGTQVILHANNIEFA